MSSILCSFFVIFFRWSTWSESFLLLPLGDNYLTLCSLCQWFSLQPSQEISLGLSLMCRHATYKIIDSLLLRFFPLQHQSSRIKCYSPQKLLNLWMNRFFSVGEINIIDLICFNLKMTCLLWGELVVCVCARASQRDVSYSY